VAQFEFKTGERLELGRNRWTVILIIMKKTTLPDFKGKVVSVGLASDHYSYAMNSPHWEIQGGKLFLIGSVPHYGSVRNWSEGVVRAIAWDEVTDYLVFESIDDYIKRQSKFHRKK
jgi:hypothetical protein